MIGKRISGRYQILEAIGGGGMANVYKAHDVILNRTVAVKVLRPQFSDDEEFIRRFHREAQAATSLSHPNVVNIFDVGEENDIYYIVMEFVDGLTLKQLIQQRGTLPIEETVHIMLQITSAISHAHENHIVHRDIKPHNILISDKGEAKVTDFGIARAMTSATITHTNSVMGSVHYLSPEQARGGLVNEKSDIYSLGIVLYEMATGKVPFSGDTAVSIAIKHLQNQVPNPRRFNPTLPQSIENIILKATAKDPFHRYAKVTELEEDLKTSLNPERVHEKKFYVPNDGDEVTKAIPIIKSNEYEQAELEETKVIETKPNLSEENAKPSKKTKKRKKKGLTFFFIAMFVIFGSVFAAFAIVPKILHVDDVTIPDDLIGMEYEEAFRQLTELGLIVERKNIPHDEIEQGHIVSSDPESGRMVKKNTNIVLSVSEGKQRLSMEDYTGRKRETVERTLNSLGFKDIKWIVDETTQYEENYVISHIPEPGVKVIPEETTVIVTYSLAPKIVLENLQGLAQTDVLDYAQKNNIRVDFNEQYSNHVPKGQVISQNPTRGKQVQKHEKITVVISLGPEPIPELPKEEPVTIQPTIEVEVLEEDELAGMSYHVTITYEDATTNGAKAFVDEVVTTTKEYKIPLVVNPNEEAVIKLFINGAEYETLRYPYVQAVKLAND